MDMFLRIHNDRGIERLYICRSRRTGSSVKSENVRSLGRIDKLSEKMNMNRDQVINWAQAQVDDLKEDSDTTIINVPLSSTALIESDKQRSFFAGYLFPQSVYYDLRMKNVMRNISSRHKYDFDLDAIFSDLIYARILEPGSKLSAYNTAKKFLEPPKYELHDIYRALSILAKEMDYILSEVYKNSNFVLKRNNRVLYYDCTNYFFEIEEEDDFRKYGKSKEHRPNPIVQMGLFMDGDGIPLTFDLFDGASNEQPSLKPLEQKIIRDFGFDKFVVCTDGGLGSDNNRQFNDIEGRAFICTQSLKKLKKKDRESAMDNRNWKRLSDHKPVNIDEIKSNPYLYSHDLYYKEDVYGTKKVPGQRMIITYSPKYAAYQKMIRESQLERASKMVDSHNVKKSRKNPNDPARFVKVVSTTEDGEVAKAKTYSIDEEKVKAEEMYDGFYAICTDLVEDDVKDILTVSEGRWEIEESFRIMKTEFKARPVHLSREDRIRAHFLTCYMALLIFRIIEKKTNCSFTTSELINTLRDYRLLKLKDYGYIPEYKRTEVTDRLHEAFGFRTDTEIVAPSAIRKIISNSKKVSSHTT